MKASFIIPLIFLIFSCAPKNKIYEISDEELYDFELLDTIVVSSPPIDQQKNPPEVYRASAERKYDLLHTKLELNFNWEKEEVMGKAYLQLKPYFYESKTLVLDAKNFTIHEISLGDKKLSFQNTGDKLWIELDRAYTKEETIDLFIDYTARPAQGAKSNGNAIQSDQGLFFINPRGEEDKPQQIWTQGETEHNSRWFPTIDKPNERCTQEIYLTVEDRFKTLSNGLLISSVDNGNGTRTDYWKQDLSHAPYLFMLSVGEYAVVEDKWNGKPLYYYVEPAFKEEAKLIFNHTPEMLEFFSELLDYPYPWDKYAQVVCRDYVSGAMENTSAVIFGEFVQRHAPELYDDPNDYIVAHEMIHHWFGNIVTCESWSNLTLNEGFANYGEYLWFEHKYGHYAAEHNRLNELSGYLGSSFGSSLHPLIHFQYEEKEQMFDAHSYNKGGLVLHMLRSYLGDEAFFASLNKYLVDNAFSAVEVDELRMSFEDVTGKDLNWFFDQWYLNQGHPFIEVDYTIDQEKNMVVIDVDQVQNTEYHLPAYTLNVDLAMYFEDGSTKYFPYTIKERNAKIEIPITGELPLFVVLDGKHDLLAVITENRSNREYVNMFKNSSEYLDQYAAINKLKFEDEMSEIVDLAIKHEFFYFRKQGVNAIYDEKYIPVLKDLMLTDNNAEVRNAAFNKLVDFDPEEAILISQEILKKDQSYSVLGNTLSRLYEIDPIKTLPAVEKIAEENPEPFYSLICDIYAATEDVKYLDFFKDHLEKVSVYELWEFAKLYVDLAERGDSNDLLSTANAFSENILDGSYLKKSMLMYNMGRIYKSLNKENEDQAAVQVKGLMQNLIDSEDDPELAEQMRSYLN